jgi:hypothetical protein
MHANRIQFTFILAFSSMLIFIYFYFEYALRAYETVTFDVDLLELRIHKNCHRSKLIVSVDGDLGYANRVYTFLNGLFIALASNSTFQTNWPGIEKHIQLHLSNLEFNQPPRMYRKPENPAKELIFNPANPNGWAKRKQFAKLKSEIPVEFQTVVIRHCNPAFFEFACNPKYFSTLRSLGLVKPGIIARAEKVLQLNGSKFTNEQKIEALYQVGFDFASVALNFIWQPNQKLKQIIDQQFDLHFKGFFVIGMQFRFRYLSNKAEEVDNFVKCAHDLESKMRNETSSEGKRVKWFLTSDFERHLDHIVRKYPEKVIKTSARFEMQDDAVLHAETGTSFEKSIVDSELLSKCHELIITGGSTFGSLAAMRMGRMPLFFNGMRNTRHCPKMTFGNLGTTPDDMAVI